MKEVVWSPIAAHSYRKNIEYLKTHWTKKEIKHFIDKVDEVIFSIQENHNIGKICEINPHYRQILVVKQITLYYRVAPDYIRLVSFFNNYQNPDRLQKFLS